MDTLSHEVFVDGVKTERIAKEYELLSYLIQNKGIACNSSALRLD